MKYEYQVSGDERAANLVDYSLVAWSRKNVMRSHFEIQVGELPPTCQSMIATSSSCKSHHNTKAGLKVQHHSDTVGRLLS